MDLKKRLAQLDRQTRRQPVPQTDNLNLPSSGEIEVTLASLGLVGHTTAAGQVWTAEHRDVLAAPASPLPDLTGLFTRGGDSTPDLAQVLFLDTETTGLAGGTGTLVFQLGLSWWSDNELITRQYFLPGPGAELAMLRHLADFAQNFAHVVTFNGASFDLPLLRTRALLNRLPDPLGELISWDLLVPARRLWGNRLPDCRQQTIEAQICGRERGAGDIDGAGIPQTWFDFLNSGQAGQLKNVLTHNHRDMVGMAEIFCRVVEVGTVLAANCATPMKLIQVDDRAWSWALGRICEHRSQPEAAAKHFRHAWTRPWGVITDGVARRRICRDAVRNLKRCRRWDLVEVVLADGLESDATDVGLHREAAILYEHRLRDLPRALTHARQAGDMHRIKRLERLLA